MVSAPSTLITNDPTSNVPVLTYMTFSRSFVLPLKIKYLFLTEERTSLRNIFIAATFEYLHCCYLFSLSFFMYLLPISLCLSMASTSSSPICCSFETPPSCFKMNIKTSSKCFEETSVPFFWKSRHVKERVSHTSATKTSPKLCREILNFRFDTFTTICIFRIF